MQRKRKFIVQSRKIVAQVGYPTIFCPHEKITIGVSQIQFKLKRLSVDRWHWEPKVSQFLKGYRIDLSNAKRGDKILCPKCSHPVDFRFFQSDTTPKLLGETE